MTVRETKIFQWRRKSVEDEEPDRQCKDALWKSRTWKVWENRNMLRKCQIRVLMTPLPDIHMSFRVSMLSGMITGCYHMLWSVFNRTNIYINTQIWNWTRLFFVKVLAQYANHYRCPTCLVFWELSFWPQCRCKRIISCRASVYFWFQSKVCIRNVASRLMSVPFRQSCCSPREHSVKELSWNVKHTVAWLLPFMNEWIQIMEHSRFVAQM